MEPLRRRRTSRRVRQRGRRRVRRRDVRVPGALHAGDVRFVRREGRVRVRVLLLARSRRDGVSAPGRARIHGEKRAAEPRVVRLRRERRKTRTRRPRRARRFRRRAGGRRRGDGRRRVSESRASVPRGNARGAHRARRETRARAEAMPPVASARRGVGESKRRTRGGFDGGFETAKRFFGSRKKRSSGDGREKAPRDAERARRARRGSRRERGDRSDRRRVRNDESARRRRGRRRRQGRRVLVASRRARQRRKKKQKRTRAEARGETSADEEFR